VGPEPVEILGNEGVSEKLPLIAEPAQLPPAGNLYSKGWR